MILKCMKQSIIHKRYEEIMCLLTSIQSSPQYQIFDNHFLHDALEVKVTNRMLSQIKRDFEKLRIR